MKLINNAKSILKTNIVSDSSSFLIQDWEGDLFKYEVNWTIANEFTIFAEEIENDIVVKREPIKVKRDWDVFAIIERKTQLCVWNDSASPKIREQKKYNFTAWKTQISMYVSENDINEINSNIDYVENIKNNWILETETDLAIKNSNWNLQKINASEINVSGIKLNGNAIWTAGWLVKTDSSNRIIWDWSVLTWISAEIKGLVELWENVLIWDAISYNTNYILMASCISQSWYMILWYSTTAWQRQWQTFNTWLNTNIKTITIKPRKNNYPSDWLRIKIYTAPNWSYLWVSNTVSASSISNYSYSAHTFTFQTAINVTANTNYFFSIDEQVL